MPACRSKPRKLRVAGPRRERLDVEVRASASLAEAFGGGGKAKRSPDEGDLLKPARIGCGGGIFRLIPSCSCSVAKHHVIKKRIGGRSMTGSIAFWVVFEWICQAGSYILDFNKPILLKKCKKEVAKTPKP